MMNIGALGTGIVGRAIAGRCTELGHDVMVGTRDPQATLSRTEPDRYGGPPFSEFHGQRPEIALGPFAEAAAHGELVVNATEGAASVQALTAAGAENLDGKVLLDVSNPLDATAGMPPPLFVSNTDSLAEQIQRAFSGARVVKSLNTMNASVMVNPEQLAGGDHTVFVSGDDAVAKAAVAELLGSFGWRDIVDLGDLSTARGAEMYVTLWVRLWGVVQDPIFNVKVVR